MDKKDIFLQRLEERKAKESIGDPKAILDDWMQSIDQLYQNIRSWLDPGIKRKLIGISRHRVTLEEKPLGRYDVDILILTLPGTSIKISPKARYVIGGTGRVDMVTVTSRVMIVRGENNEWRFADYDNSKWVFTNLNEKTFWERIEALAS